MFHTRQVATVDKTAREKFCFLEKQVDGKEAGEKGAKDEDYEGNVVEMNVRRKPEL